MNQPPANSETGARRGGSETRGNGGGEEGKKGKMRTKKSGLWGPVKTTRYGVSARRPMVVTVHQRLFAPRTEPMQGCSERPLQGCPSMMRASANRPREGI